MSDATWEEIDEIGNLGLASSTWSVGDTKEITIGNETMTVEILDFNNGPANYILFGTKNVLNTPKAMRGYNTTSGSYQSTDVYSYLENDVYNNLPSDLKSVVKTVIRKVTAGSGSTNIGTFSCKLFCFSASEVFGDNRNKEYAPTEEGSQIAGFVNVESRVKRADNGSGNAQLWWLRSPCVKFNTRFCLVGTGGFMTSDNATASNYICFGFFV